MTGCFLFMGIILINKIKNIIICGEWLRKIYLEFWLVCAKCSQLVLLHSSNSVEKLCGEWVLSASVCVARSPVYFCYATTEAERRPLVVSVPIPLRTQQTGVPTRRKAFLLNLPSP